MIGQRVEYAGTGPLPVPGSFWLHDGVWYGITPNGHLCSFAQHDVTLHADNRLTVVPSIRVSDARGEVWHGYLTYGVWTPLAPWTE